MIQKLKRQVSSFIVIGLITVALDFAIYSILLWLDVAIPLAKALGFMLAGLFTYAANRHFTFRSHHSTARMLKSFAVYVVSLVTNTGVNQLVLDVLGLGELEIIAAFIVATGVSATMNFVGLKLIVFRGVEDERR